MKAETEADSEASISQLDRLKLDTALIDRPSFLGWGLLD